LGIPLGYADKHSPVNVSTSLQGDFISGTTNYLYHRKCNSPLATTSEDIPIIII